MDDKDKLEKEIERLRELIRRIKRQAEAAFYDSWDPDVRLNHIICLCEDEAPKDDNLHLEKENKRKKAMELWQTQNPRYVHSMKWRDKETGIEHMTVIRTDDLMELAAEINEINELALQHLSSQKLQPIEPHNDPVPEPLPGDMEEDEDEEKGGDPPVPKIKYDPNFCHYHHAGMEMNKYGPFHKTEEGYCKGNWCIKHKRSFTHHQNREGEMWWSHPIGDGSYCNGGAA